MFKNNLYSGWVWLWRHTKPLLMLNDNKRPWGFLAVAALSVGIPVFIGALLDQFSTALIASMGGLVILYMQQTKISYRMTTLMICSFGFAVSFSLGLLTSFNIYLSTFTLALTVFFATIICRYFAVPPPGTFFFTLVACLARTLPYDMTLAAERVEILLFGCMWACGLALIYGVTQIRRAKNKLVRPVASGDKNIAAIMVESTIISFFIGGGYLFALLLNLDNPYWVPVSTAAIIQGATFRAVWHRNVHRIAGTAIGMLLAWVIFSLSPTIWELAILITVLSFVIELLIVRNYGLAVIFITPLTLIYADAATATDNTAQLMMTRLFDIILGSTIGYLGGWVMHHPKLARRFWG